MALQAAAAAGLKQNSHTRTVRCRGGHASVRDSRLVEVGQGLPCRHPVPKSRRRSAPCEFLSVGMAGSSSPACPPRPVVEVTPAEWIEVSSRAFWPTPAPFVLVAGSHSLSLGCNQGGPSGVLRLMPLLLWPRPPSGPAHTSAPQVQGSGHTGPVGSVSPALHVTPMLHPTHTLAPAGAPAFCTSCCRRSSVAAARGPAGGTGLSLRCSWVSTSSMVSG